MLLEVILLVAFCMAAADSIGAGFFRRRTKRMAAALFAAAEEAAEYAPAINAPETLPRMMQSYLERAAASGQNQINAVRMRQSGALQVRPGGAWQPLLGKMFLTVHPHGLVWFIDLTTSLFISRKIRISLIHGAGRIAQRWWSFIPLALHSDEEALSRLVYLASLAWNPDGWLSKKLQWASEEGQGVKVRFSDQPDERAATLIFDESGDLVSIAAEIRAEEWFFSFRQFEQVQGRRLPMAWSIHRGADGGDWHFGEGTVTDIALDQPYAWW